MNDGHIQALKGWPQGEEILDYIRRLEEENRCLNNMVNRIPDVVSMLIALHENLHVYSYIMLKEKVKHILEVLKG